MPEELVIPIRGDKDCEALSAAATELEKAARALAAALRSPTLREKLTAASEAKKPQA